MSKRIFATLIMIAALAGANSAYASRARLGVLGTADPTGVLDRGSFFIDDYQNIFYNPAQINNFKNWAAIEKSNGGANAEGGFATQISSFNLGVYMNRGGAVTGTYTTNPVRPIDITFGADMGVKWGVGVTFASSSQGPDTSGQHLTLRAGADISGIEPFAHFKLLGNDKLNAAATNKNADMGAGVRYKFGEWVPFAAIRQTRITPQGGTSTAVTSDFIVGGGRNARVAEGIRLNYALAFVRDMKVERSVIPIDLSAEGDATSWLVLRAGVSYRLMDQIRSQSQADATTGRVGASINVGRVSFDWAIGGGTATEVAVDDEQFSLAGNFFTAASLNYRL